MVPATEIAVNEEPEFVNALRIHTSLTAEVEKRLLIWMAQRTPAAINPDHLTAMAFIFAVTGGRSLRIGVA